MPRPETVSARRLRLVLSTVPPRAASAIARRLVEGRLAACVTSIPGARSVYRWRGRLESSGETLLVVKTTAKALGDLVAALVKAHPHEVPEVLVFEPKAGTSPYVKWVVSTAGGARRNPRKHR